jgi:hypothetical protein
MYELFANTPGWAVLATFMVVPGVLAAALHAVFRRIVPGDSLLPHHDVAGYLVSIVGILYAVVLGFMVINVWSSFDLAQRNADAETTEVSAILYTTQTLPGRTHTELRKLLGQYAHEVRDVEWPLLADGREDPRARAIMISAFHTIASMPTPPHTDQAELLRLNALRQSALVGFRELAAHRRLRILDSQSHLQPPMYFAIIVGGVVLLAFVLLFGVKNMPLQLVMTGLVAAMIGLQIGVIFEMDRPFWGAIHVTPDAWSVLIADNRLGAP